MGERYEIRLSGSGGQGLILAGIILAEAAGVYGDKQVAQTQAYGPEARGGASKAEVIISDEEIDYPMATRLDLLLAMNQKSCDSFYFDLKPKGMLVVDSTFVTQTPTTRAIRIPFTEIARKQLGKEMVANIVALGAIATLTGIVSQKAIKAAVLARVPPGTEELNTKALQLGSKEARSVLKKRSAETMQGYDSDHEDTPYE
jgi:2-oxoglutarate ferredoxin oxidoreductase subunit gamma